MWKKNLYYVYSYYKTGGPLNKGSSKEYSLVYLNEPDSILQTPYQHGFERNFRNPLYEERIGNVFQSFMVIGRSQLEMIPNIRPVSLNKSCKQIINEKKSIRIACIPYIGFDSFYFHERDSEMPCGPSVMPQGDFYIDYEHPTEKYNISCVVSLLESAIQGGANIVVFPEYIMSPKMLTEVKAYLKNLESSKKSHLAVVYAGTCYHWDGNEENNILHILNANGVEIGECYKCKPFLVASEAKVHGQTLDKSSQTAHSNQLRKYFSCLEILSDPGKECTLLDIESIGRSLPAVCRDVTDGFAEKIAELFFPTFLIVPAWSKSTSSFEQSFSKLAANLHTVSLLCNCCNAVIQKGNPVNGKITLPRKEKSQMVGEHLNIIPEKCCKDSCQKNCGCIKQIEIGFGDGAVRASWNSISPKKMS